MRLYVVGTDTGVGKTRVTAALACAMPRAVTIVKLAQTGLPPGVSGDAEDAARLADAARARNAALASRRAGPTAWRELARFGEPADPWNAALVAHAPPLEIAPQLAALDAIGGDLIVEGSGGAAVPFNAGASISDVALAARCEAVLVVALRLGCINHALLTLAFLERSGMPVRGAITTEPYAPVAPAYRNQVERVLAPKVTLTRHIAFETDAARSVADAAAHLAPFLEYRRCNPPSIPRDAP
ncbi:MAG: hypothetical protein NVSMB19_15100 [Vulcanimicrobiaceae bacterium]